MSLIQKTAVLTFLPYSGLNPESLDQLPQIKTNPNKWQMPASDLKPSLLSSALTYSTSIALSCLQSF